MSTPGVWYVSSTNRATAEPIAAQSAAHLLLISRAIKNKTPVTHELIRKTCDIPINQYFTTKRKSRLISVLSWVVNVGVERNSPGIPAISLEARTKIQVVITNGQVSEFKFHFPTTLFIAVRIQTLNAAPKTSATHICQVFPKNVAKAPPTRIPLKPQRPSLPSSFGSGSKYPVIVETRSPTRAPQATIPRASS